MAVVKASYKKGGSSGAIKYALHRDAGEEHRGERRTGFTADREGLDTKQSVDSLKQHENGKGYTYHIVLNAGDGKQPPADLQQWTRDTMRALEQKHGREIPYVAVIHKDHADHAHVHIVAHTEKTLRKEELNHTRSEATRLYNQQRDLHRDHFYDQSESRQHQRVREQDRQREGQREPQSQQQSKQEERQPSKGADTEEARKPTPKRQTRLGDYDGLEWQNTTKQQEADERWLASRPSMITSGATSREFAERYMARQQWIAEKQAERKAKQDAERQKWRAKSDEWKQHKQEVREASRTGRKILRDMGYGR